MPAPQMTIINMWQQSHDLDRNCEPLRLAMCPDCGYSLNGLPDRGRCPGCGFEFHPRQIILYGWASGSKATVVNARGGTVGLIAIAFVLLVFFADVAWGHSIPLMALRPLVAPLCIAAAVLIGVLLWRRQRLVSSSSAPVQVRLMPEGLAQRDGMGPVPLSPWSAELHAELTPVGAYRYRLVVQRLRHNVAQPFSQLVDFEFACRAEPAAIIRRQIRQWQAAASARE